MSSAPNLGNLANLAHVFSCKSGAGFTRFTGFTRKEKTREEQDLHDLQGHACQDDQVCLIVPLTGLYESRALARQHRFGRPRGKFPITGPPQNPANRENLANPAHALLFSC